MSSSTGPTGSSPALNPWITGQPSDANRDEQLRADLQQINRDATARLDAKLAARHPRRTICADCTWYGPGFWATPATCLHQNARDLVTGLPTPCRSRNNGSCPDFTQRDP